MQSFYTLRLDTSIFVSNSKKAFDLSTHMILVNPLTRGGVPKKKRPPPHLVSKWVLYSTFLFTIYNENHSVRGIQATLASVRYFQRTNSFQRKLALTQKYSDL